MSLPVRGAWIEITYAVGITYKYASLPVRGAWIEISGLYSAVSVEASLPVRGAWIEILNIRKFIKSCEVAPRAGSVD